MALKTVTTKNWKDIAREIEGKELVAGAIFSGKLEKEGRHGSVEWAIAWLAADDGFISSYCNTIPTPEGGTVTMDSTELMMLLDGIDVRYVRRPALWEPKPKTA